MSQNTKKSKTSSKSSYKGKNQVDKPTTSNHKGKDCLADEEEKKGTFPTNKECSICGNTAVGILVRRLQEGEVDLGHNTDYRVRMAGMAGTPLSLVLTSSNPWGP